MRRVPPIGPLRVLTASHTRAGVSARYGGVGDVGSDHTDFFCSELVAAAYQALAVLPPRRVAASYWPCECPRVVVNGAQCTRLTVGAWDVGLRHQLTLQAAGEWTRN